MKDLSLAILFCFAFFCANAQTPKRSPILLDSSARKHELQLNVGTVVGFAFYNGIPSGGFDLTYSRVFEGTHHARVGIGYSHYGTYNSELYFPFIPIPDTVPIYNFGQGRYADMAWIKAGYEISIGKTRTRFLFGMDVMLGYLSSGSYMSYGTAPMQEMPTIQQVDQRGIFVGLNPRTSVRYNFSPLFTGGLTLGWVFNSEFILYERNISSLQDPFVFEPAGGIFPNFTGGLKPEVNLIFKIPEKYKYKCVGWGTKHMSRKAKREYRKKEKRS